MTNEELYKKIVADFPDFIDLSDPGYGTHRLSYCACQLIDLSEDLELNWAIVEHVQKEAVRLKLPVTPFISEIMKCDDYEDIEEKMSALAATDIDAIIAGIKAWKKKCDTLRMDVQRNEDVLVIVHTDIDKYSVPDLIKGFTYLAEDPAEPFKNRLGIINTRLWNFKNPKFRDLLNENSGDCFQIWKTDKGEIHRQDLDNLYAELKTKYPNIDAIRNIYDTDWD
jgi:hypothetical protein